MNDLFTIVVDYNQGIWAFDYDPLGVVREPFVAGTDEFFAYWYTNRLTDGLAPEPGIKIRVTFSKREFPDSEYLRFTGEEFGGVTWIHEDTGKQGWLCPCLWKFFSQEEGMKGLYFSAALGV